MQLTEIFKIQKYYKISKAIIHRNAKCFISTWAGILQRLPFLGIYPTKVTEFGSSVGRVSKIKISRFFCPAIL